MSHQRLEIREHVTTLLRDNIQNVQVFSSRLRALNNENLPAILIYTRTESTEKFAEAPRELDRNLELLVEIKVDGLYDCDDVADQFAGQVEDLIHQDDSFGELVNDVLLSNTDIEFFNEGAKPFCVARLTFDVQYFTFTNIYIEPNDFDSAEFDLDLNNDQSVEIKTHIQFKTD